VVGAPVSSYTDVYSSQVFFANFFKFNPKVFEH